MDHLGCLYKFHGMQFATRSGCQILQPVTHFNIFCFIDRPCSYLYNTLHFYERNLRDRPPLKRLLVKSIINPLSVGKPVNWAVSEQYQTQYLEPPDTEVTSWQPELTYYITLVRRLVDSTLDLDIFLHFLPILIIKKILFQPSAVTNISTSLTGASMSSRMRPHTLCTLLVWSC